MQAAKNNIIPVHSHFQGKFNTHTGRLIDLVDPDPENLHIEDIATALSRICRFGGHSSAFYSVAQHSILVTALVPQECQKAALLHDAAEAYLGDVIKPLKVLLGAAYKQLEDRFETAIYRKYGVQISSVVKAEVKQADMLMLEMEHEALILQSPGRLNGMMHNTAWEWYDENGKWAWDSETAREIFMQVFNQLFEQ